MNFANTFWIYSYLLSFYNDFQNIHKMFFIHVRNFCKKCERHELFPPLLETNKTQKRFLKGLSHEIDFKNINKNLQNLA
jgi:hypothetical protein